VLGPGLAGGIAVWLGAREIFFVDAATFIIAALFILTLPSLLVEQKKAAVERPRVLGRYVKRYPVIIF
jgi:NRE family putative nickel resistance protein-like MFS transporter